MFQPATLKRWYILYPNEVQREAIQFHNRVRELARNMGFEIAKPREYVYTYALYRIICILDRRAKLSELNIVAFVGWFAGMIAT